MATHSLDPKFPRRTRHRFFVDSRDIADQGTLLTATGVVHSASNDGFTFVTTGDVTNQCLIMYDAAGTEVHSVQFRDSSGSHTLSVSDSLVVITLDGTAALVYRIVGDSLVQQESLSIPDNVTNLTADVDGRSVSLGLLYADNSTDVRVYRDILASPSYDTLSDVGWIHAMRGGNVLAITAATSAESPPSQIAVYRYTDDVWVGIDVIAPEEGVEGFGWGDMGMHSLGLSGDGTILAVGAYGTAFVYKWYGNYWDRIATADTFPYTPSAYPLNKYWVSVSRDGSIVAMLRVYFNASVYDVKNNTWESLPVPEAFKTNPQSLYMERTSRLSDISLRGTHITVSSGWEGAFTYPGGSPFQLTVYLDDPFKGIGGTELHRVETIELKSLAFPKIANETYVIMDIEQLRDDRLISTNTTVVHGFAVMYFDASTLPTGDIKPMKGMDFWQRDIVFRPIVPKLTTLSVTFKKPDGNIVSAADTGNVRECSFMLEITTLDM